MQTPNRLLIVEDNEDIRQVIAQVLKEEGYEVIEASNGAEGLAALSAERPSLILLDLQMPVMTGWSFMQQLEERAYHVPIIIMSAQEHWTSQFEELGAVDYLNKPFDMNDLLTKVAAYRR